MGDNKRCVVLVEMGSYLCDRSERCYLLLLVCEM